MNDQSENDNSQLMIMQLCLMCDIFQFQKGKYCLSVSPKRSRNGQYKELHLYLPLRKVHPQCSATNCISNTCKMQMRIQKQLIFNIGNKKIDISSRSLLCKVPPQPLATNCIFHSVLHFMCLRSKSLVAHFHLWKITCQIFLLKNCYTHEYIWQYKNLY